jgi:NAD(P)-dependent dehydrogenase (short-subunit alcohol dehydrogenase family)
MSEQQRVAIVTGAAGGIGREVVLGLLGKEIEVAAVDRTVSPNLRKRCRSDSNPPTS